MKIVVIDFTLLTFVYPNGMLHLKILHWHFWIRCCGYYISYLYIHHTHFR